MRFNGVTLAFMLAAASAVAGQLATVPTGPTLHLDYGHGQPFENPIGTFMYFVPLISLDPVRVFTSAGNTQCVRVVSNTCRISGGTFQAACEFELTGEGFLGNVLDHTNLIHRHEKELKAGGLLKRQLGSINLQGQGSGKVEIEGTVTNGIRSVNKVRLRFNNHGRPSPVSISLQDIRCHGGVEQIENEIIARVNVLTFQRTVGPPKMEVILASVKRKDASDTVWQNFIGSLKGKLANQLLPPIRVDSSGQKTMLDFGLALAAEAPAFTFPYAERLQTTP